MKINKEEIKPTSNSVYNTKDKDHFRTYYFLFIYEIIENEALYSKETRDVKLKTIGNVSNLNVSNFTANLIYKDKKIKIDLKRVENCFYLDENSTYEFYGIFNIQAGEIYLVINFFRIFSEKLDFDRYEKIVANRRSLLLND